MRTFIKFLCVFTLLLSVTISKGPDSKHKAIKKLVLLGSSSEDDIAKGIVKGIAKSLKFPLTHSLLNKINSSVLQLQDLEDQLYNFGAIQFDQSLLPYTLEGLYEIFSNLQKALPKSANQLTQPFLDTFQTVKTFNDKKEKLYEATGIDGQLYLWGSLDYFLFSDFETVGETIGKVISLMQNF